jgi:hypothetical protein
MATQKIRVRESCILHFEDDRTVRSRTEGMELHDAARTTGEAKRRRLRRGYRGFRKLRKLGARKGKFWRNHHAE